MQGVPFALAVSVILVGVLTNLFLLLSARGLFQAVLAFMLILAAVIGSFGSSYGVVIDGAMVRNILATDRREAGELLTASLAFHVVLSGVLPALAVGFVRVRSRGWRRDLRDRAITFCAVLVLILATVLLNYKDFALIGREHKELRLSINPLCPMYAMAKHGRAESSRSRPVTAVGPDAHRTSESPGKKRTVVVLVVGETAREKEFSLNGYRRRTNPYLEKDGVISFTGAYACGTSTAESVPCMFSHLEKGAYSVSKAARYENVLDVLTRAGVTVFWRDNNSGCKGVCERVATEDVSHAYLAGSCNGDECFDEVLLDRLEERIAGTKGDVLVVLHRKGSHGPAYYRRHPASFSVFTPECRTNALQDCSTGDIVNAYDNSILYADFFLHRTIALLRNSSAVYNAMNVYFSDHGESPGESGLYLHGIPSFFAPDDQTHVPFIVWMSDGYADSHRIDRNCLQNHHARPYSHSNLFHSLLGAFHVRTVVYDRGSDVFAACQSG